MRITRCVLIAVLLFNVILLFGCQDKPAYYHPYGDGVDPDTVTTVPVATRPTNQTAAGFDANITTVTTTSTSAPTSLVIPDGYKRCPECNGERVVCEFCEGTDKRKAETYDPDSGTYVRHYTDCMNCSFEDPGYYLCKTCQNKLIVEE